MEDQDRTGEDALAGERIRNLDIFGRELAVTFVRNFRSATYASPEAFAVILEAVAKALTSEAEILRRGRIR